MSIEQLQAEVHELRGQVEVLERALACLLRRVGQADNVARDLESSTEPGPESPASTEPPAGSAAA